jgi:hypothetical protein
MSTYETLIVINETGNLIGQMMFDILSVAFAILVAGFVMGDRLNRGMIGVITLLSAVWILPMLANAQQQFQVMAVLARSLTVEQLGELSELAQYTGYGSILAGNVSYAIIVPHFAIYLGSIWFLIYRSKQADQMG